MYAVFVSDRGDKRGGPVGTEIMVERNVRAEGNKKNSPLAYFSRKRDLRPRVHLWPFYTSTDQGIGHRLNWFLQPTK
jgi:hypothetical protein